MGNARAGKTARLIAQLQQWQSQDTQAAGRGHRRFRGSSAILVFAATADNRAGLLERLTLATGGQPRLHSTTPLAFFEDEVMLFWPLLTQQLNLAANFPLRLRPETEQELATRCWQSYLDRGCWQIEGVSRPRMVRRGLDLLQLAAFASTPLEDLSLLLAEGESEPPLHPDLWPTLTEMLLGWRDWCLQRGLLTYGILTELYWRYLLPQPDYQTHLHQRYRAVLADDVDNYPAIARDLFECLLEQGAVGLFTFNPKGSIRWGLGADPDYLAGLSLRCQVEELTTQPESLLDGGMMARLEDLYQGAIEVPTTFQSIQTVSRSQLLRQIAKVILTAVQSGQVEPQEIAIIGPGLDAITRYSLTEMLQRQGIGVEALNDQRPLNSSALIRSLLTLLALLYPGCGRLVEREQVAELLVILSGLPAAIDQPAQSKIDPVRAGLLADHCFQPHPDHPQLLPITQFPRWDRLGYVATITYTDLQQWVEQQRRDFSTSTQPYLTLSPVFVLDRAIQKFLWPNNLHRDQLATLRALMETAQHYWTVHTRLAQNQPMELQAIVSDFIHLLRSGTITANPFPLSGPSRSQRGITLASTFQYRNAHLTHRWHFWLDVGGPLWQGGGSVVLWGAPLLLKQPQLHFQPTPEQDQEQLRRLLLDLCSRVQERVYLCHSDLAVTGQEQAGPLLTLVDASLPLAV